MANILKKLNWVHIGLILILPIILALINPNWIFNLSIADDYIYTGYQIALPKYVGWEPSSTHYFMERLSVILPGYVVRQFFSPLMANFVLHLGVYYLATFSVYGILNKLFNARIGIIIALLFGQFSLIVRATGWDYVDGYGLIYMTLSLYCLTQAAYSRRRSVYLVGAGAFFMLLIISNLFNLQYAPALAIYLLFLESLYKHPVRLLKTGLFVLIGMGIAYGTLAIFYYQLTGNLLLSNSVKFIRSSGEALSTFSQTAFSNVPPHWYLFLTLIAVIAIGRILTLKTTPLRINEQSELTPLPTLRAVVGLFVASCGVMMVWRLLGHFYMSFSFYNTNIVMTGFILLGMIFSHKVVDMPPTRFRYVMGAAFFLPMLTPIILTFAPQVRTDTAIQIIFISAIVCAGAIVLLHRKQTIQWLILFVMLTSVIATLNLWVNIYNPDRYISQRVYEKTMDIVQVINQRYDDFSLDTFRIWYPNNDPERRMFAAVSSIYLLEWGRRLNPITLSQLLTPHEIVMLSSADNVASFMEYAQNTIYDAGFEIVQTEELVFEDITQDIILNFIAIRPYVNTDGNFYYSFGARHEQIVLNESGWNGYERSSPTNTFRWTSDPMASVLLDVTEFSIDLQQDYRLSFVVVSSLEEEVVNSLSLTINGELVTLTRTDNRYEAVISGELLNAPTLELIFQTDRVSNPFDLGIQDGRKLGVAIGELMIEPFIDGVTD